MAYRGERRNWIFNIPPRELKSFMVSVCFPAWVLGNQPHEKFIVASHTMRPLAEKLSNDCRMLMESAFYKTLFPETVIQKFSQSLIVTTKNGHRLAASVETGITGLGGNYLILDDGNKPDEALSPTIRIGTNNWIDNTLMSRLDDRTTGRIIGVAQRVHEDDASAHLKSILNNPGVISLPAEAYKNISYRLPNGKTYTMLEGELLHPSRLPKHELESLEKQMSSYSYAGQYLQNPVPVGGGMFKKEFIQYYDLEKFNFGTSTGFILCDPAGVGDVPGATKRKKSDWTAFVVVALSADGNYYLLDIVRDKFNPTERVDALFELHRLWNGRFGRPLKVGYESYGIQSDNHYVMKKQEDESYRFPLIPLGGKMSKPDRIARLIPDMENGRWYFPRQIKYKDTKKREWELIAELIEGEMLTFPVSNHDDTLDALSRIYDNDMEAKFPKLIRKEIKSTDELLSNRESESWINW